MKYDPKKIEKKWQKRWLEERIFRAHDDSKKPKYYQLETFPYPSSAGLHVGHPKGYIAEDIHARYMRMKGCEVLYAMGWDAFGLPTENYAIKVGRSPKEVAAENIKNFKRQVQMFGLSYDWEREINTSNPEYYKWTQWLFIQLFKKGLAYRAKAKVNWCPKDQTVLANEQVVNGKCERCGSVIEERDMEQWFLKITDYAERLLTDLKGLDWPAATIKRQEDWIGKSEGALIRFMVHGSWFMDKNESRTATHELEIFTTRPDTLFGATFLVISPELAEKWMNVGWKASEEVKKYVKKSLSKRELERMETQKNKTGVATGIFALNPASKEEIPVWVADYVMGSYGTGAIMAVPGHDERDFEFAKKFKLPIKMVVCPHYPAKTCPVLDTAYTGEGHMVDSGKFDGMRSGEAKWEITKFLGGEKKIQYKLRNWSISRQRYWGAPIPMIHCEKCALRDPSGQGIFPVDEKDLPVILPDLENYRPRGVPPLASSKEFINVKCPKCRGEAKRDPETLDTFVDSSWYYLRYTDPHNDKAPFDKAKARHWLPVDLYVIGAEHTVLHLLYSRFITKFLHGEGYLSFTEPFLKLRHQGLILGVDSKKMSKSKGNVVNPDELIEEFGADTVRIYEMFMGPFEDGAPWDPKGILGAERFLKRFWNFVQSFVSVPYLDTGQAPAGTRHEVESLVHKTIKKVGEDIENFKFNTAVSSLMILLNGLEGTALEKKDLEIVIKLLQPFAPHIAQELWELSGHKTILDFEPWPEYDPKLIQEDKFTLVIQVNGKVRDTIEVDSGIGEAEAKKLAQSSERVKQFLGKAIPKKTIYVPKKLVNIVI